MQLWVSVIDSVMVCVPGRVQVYVVDAAVGLAKKEAVGPQL
jgi:hypothetical protein